MMLPRPGTMLLHPELTVGLAPMITCLVIGEKTLVLRIEDNDHTESLDFCLIVTQLSHAATATVQGGQ